MDSVIALIFIFGTPALAIVGGILAAILRTRGQHRLIELAQRERIAAIERGLDLSQLPPLPILGVTLTARQAGLRRAQGLFIGGIVTLALGVGLCVTMFFLPSGDGGDTWSIGFVPAFLGVALLIASNVVRKSADDEA